MATVSLSNILVVMDLPIILLFAVPVVTFVGMTFIIFIIMEIGNCSRARSKAKAAKVGWQQADNAEEPKELDLSEELHRGFGPEVPGFITGEEEESVPLGTSGKWQPLRLW